MQIRVIQKKKSYWVDNAKERQRNDWTRCASVALYLPTSFMKRQMEKSEAQNKHKRLTLRISSYKQKQRKGIKLSHKTHEQLSFSYIVLQNYYISMPDLHILCVYTFLIPSSDATFNFKQQYQLIKPKKKPKAQVRGRENNKRAFLVCRV